MIKQTVWQKMQEEYAKKLDTHIERLKRDYDERSRTLSVEEFEMWKQYCHMLELAYKNPTVGDAWEKFVVVYNLAK